MHGSESDLDRRRDRSVNIAAQVRQQFFRSHRPREQEALTAFAIQFLKSLELRVCLDAFGDHLQVEILRHRDDRADELGVRSVVIYELDERAVDLECRDRKPNEVPEVGIASSEIVDVEIDAEFAELIQHLDRSLLVFEKDRLGDLELQPRRREVGPVQNVLDLIYEERLGELTARQIDAQFQRVYCDLFVDLSDLRAGLVEDELSQRIDEAGFFGERNKFGGKDLAQLRVVPTCQSLDAF